MKGLALLTIALLTPGLAAGTSMSPPPPIWEVVRLSDHIFWGIVEKIEVIGSDGTVISQPPTPLNRDMRIRLTVTPDPQWLRTHLKKLPTQVSITYDYGKFILSLASERDRYLGKRWLFLLSGSDFHPAAFMSFATGKDKLPEVMDAIERQPVE